MFTEDLLNYETDASNEGLERSVHAWEKVLSAWHLIPDTEDDRKRVKGVITTALSAGRGKRGLPSPHRTVIYNHKEVREAIFTDDRMSHFRWAWRD